MSNSLEQLLVDQKYDSCESRYTCFHAENSQDVCLTIHCIDSMLAYLWETMNSSSPEWCISGNLDDKVNERKKRHKLITTAAQNSNCFSNCFSNCCDYSVDKCSCEAVKELLQRSICRKLGSEWVTRNVAGIYEDNTDCRVEKLELSAATELLADITVCISEWHSSGDYEHNYPTPWTPYLCVLHHVR